MREITVALRRLRGTPRMALLALATLTSGMSLALVAFGILATAVLRPPPGVDAGRDLLRLFVAQETQTRGPWRNAMVVSLDQFSLLEQALDDIVDLAAYAPVKVSLASGRMAEALVVTERYFSLLGVRPLAGTLLISDSPGDARNGVVVSHRLVRELYGDAKPGTAATVAVNGMHLPVAGVTDPQFGGLEAPAADVWIFSSAAMEVPGLTRALDARNTMSWNVIGERLPHVSDIQLDDALRRAAAALKQADWRTGVDFRISRGSLLSPRGGHSLPVAEQLPTILLALSAVVLAIAIANLGGFQLSQAIERRRELAVRIALGARPSDLVRLQLAETGLIAAGAGALSLGGVWVLHPIVGRLVPNLHSTVIDWRLVVVTVGVTIVSAAAVAFVPVLFALQQRRRPELGENAYSGSAGSWNRAALGVQGALAVVLIVVAAALLASVRAVQSEPLGFARDGLLIGTIELLGHERPSFPQRGLLSDPFSLSRQPLLALRDSVRRLAGVDRASIATGAPMGRLGALFVSRRGGPRNSTSQNEIGAVFNAVDEEFFATAGLQIRRGRSFAPPDFDHTFAATVISANLAQNLFGDSDPVGECVTLNGAGDQGAGIRDCTLVIGVVEDAKYLSIVEAAQPTIYFPLSPNTPLNAAAIYVRQHDESDVSASVIVRLMRQADPRPARIQLHTLRELIAPQTARYQLASTAATLLSIAGLVMLTTGLAAHLRVVFAARRREIGVRLALGARPRDIGRFVGHDMLVGIALGVGAGTLLAFAAIRYVRPLLHGVSGFEAWSYASAVGIVAAVAITAIAVPAVWLTRKPPIEALR